MLVCSSDRVPPTSWMSASHGCQAPRGNPDTRRSSGHSASTGALPLLLIRRAASQPSRLAARAAAYQRRPYPCSDPFKHRRDGTNTGRRNQANTITPRRSAIAADPRRDGPGQPGRTRSSTRSTHALPRSPLHLSSPLRRGTRPRRPNPIVKHRRC